ncbi:MAG: cysteine rich repeat-containing protein [Desulfoferrobacter sp.]
MRKVLFLLVAIGFTLTFMGNAHAAKDLVQTVKDGCKKELESYCKDVTPGKGRVLACLYAYEDKLSGGCVYALYDASVQLERAVTALTYLANECRDDLKEYCASVEVGEGRLLKCLEKHEAKVSDRCKQAVKDVGLK